MKSKKTIGMLGYLLCIIFGGVFSFLVIDFPPAIVDKPVVDVKVHVPEPTVIHDTVIRPEVKFKYVYRKRDYCCSCVSDTTR